MVGLEPKAVHLNTPLGIIGFEQPAYLWLFALCIPILVLTWFSRRTLSSRRRWVSLTARLLLLTVLVLGLSGLTRKNEVDALGVVFVVDQSASVGSAGRKKAVDFINQSLTHQEADDVSGVVVFGAEALVDTSPIGGLKTHQISSKPSPHHTDIAAGLRLATAVMPPDRARRIVILSDGIQTKGKAENQILLTAGTDLEIATVNIGSQTGPDARLEELVIPSRLDQGAAFRMRIVARAGAEGTGRVRIYKNERYLGEKPIRLSSEQATILEIPQFAENPGLYRYRAVLEVDEVSQDSIAQNNVVMGTVQVTGQPRVLLVEGKRGALKWLARVFREQNVLVDVVPPTQIPVDLRGLRSYSAVVLADVPAFMLTQRQMISLESFVRDLGRGLMMVGGDQSFGVGGYFKTPIERALPVNMDLEDKTRFPTVGVVMAIDKSCSMGGGAGSKLEMAKEAAILSTELLQEQDLLGVIGFDGAASWIVPLQALTNVGKVRNTVASIRAGGGTDIFPALNKSVVALEQSNASLKHIILLSDGVTASGDYKTLIQRARADKITLTTLTFGSDADRLTMQNFANWGGGKYYLVTDAKTIPAIFTREIMLASRSFLVEKPVTAMGGAYSEVTRGISVESLPTFYGYVATEAKQRAIVPWSVQDEEYTSPLLAHWRYGLGRSVAFSSDVKPQWSKDWVGTESFTRTWTQVARWLIGETMGQSIDVSTEIIEGEMNIVVDAFDLNGDFRNFLKGSARVVAPDLTVHEVALRQVGPGRYEGALKVDQDGSWLAGISMKEGTRIVGQTVSEAVQPYSPEYRVQAGGAGHLTELGRLGGGGVLTEPKQVFERPQQARLVPQPLWSHCVWLAAVLLLLDVALRRLEWGGPAPQKIQTVQRTQIRTPRIRRTTRKVPITETEEEVEDEPPELPPPSSPTQVAPESYAGRLLAARNRANRRFEDEDS